MNCHPSPADSRRSSPEVRIDLTWCRRCAGGSFALLGLLLLLAAPLAATTRLQKLAEDRYVITHKKQTGFAGRGKAIRMGNEKAASLCVIVGYKWFEVRDMQAQGRGFARTAAATMEVKFYKEDEKEDLNNCEMLATEEQKAKMKKSLAKIKKK